MLPLGFTRLAISRTCGRHLVVVARLHHGVFKYREQMNKVFLEDNTYGSFTYRRLFELSRALSRRIVASLQQQQQDANSIVDLKIAVYCHNNYTYLVSLLAVWMARATPVCLSKLYTPSMLDHFVADSQCKLLIDGDSKHGAHASAELLSAVLSRRRVVHFKIDETQLHNEPCGGGGDDELGELDERQLSLLLYTSGTSGAPKGCSITADNLLSSVRTMIDAYAWTSSDSMLATLPLNHYSGLVYGLLTPFFVGARCHLLAKFDASLVWSKLVDTHEPTNVFIGVPTIFTQLVERYRSDSRLRTQLGEARQVASKMRSKMRFVASGSAPLNERTFDEWRSLTDCVILERYGMTEIGMAMTKPYKDATRRVGGAVGRPVGAVRVRLVSYAEEDDDTSRTDHADDKVLIESGANDDRIVCDGGEETHLFGELQISGPTVFAGYLNNTEQTALSFTRDGWFRTGCCQ